MTRLLAAALLALVACGGAQKVEPSFTEGTYCIDLKILNPDGEVHSVVELPHCFPSLEECNAYRELGDAYMELEAEYDPTIDECAGWWFESLCARK